jgi:hypothetical protein
VVDNVKCKIALYGMYAVAYSRALLHLYGDEQIDISSFLECSFCITIFDVFVEFEYGR